jgi:selenocysteine-specific elongation factor
MIVATAGHVDHGKTSLVKQLTGVDTDRLAEEKRRGLSINLGFAYRRVNEQTSIAFIDVPGHKNFINTMISGITGIDLGMLVIAADDGVMPQTLEHLQVLDLLGVKDIVVVISKIDRVNRVRIERLRSHVLELLPHSQVFEVSNTEDFSKSGIHKLQTFLDKQACVLKPRGAEGLFRMSIDRAFTLKGSGLVVTGTVTAGTARVGDSLRLESISSNQCSTVRIRSIHTHNEQADEGRAGQRCAFNIAGDFDKQSVRRGDYLSDPRCIEPGFRFDARLQINANVTFPIKHMLPVKIYAGANRVAAKIFIPKKEQQAATAGGRILLAADNALVQIILREALLLCHGDRFLVRDDSESINLGGGTVLLPHAMPWRKGDLQHLQYLSAMECDDAMLALKQTVLEDQQPLDYSAFILGWNMTKQQSQALLLDLGLQQGAELIVLGEGKERREYLVPEQRLQEQKQQICQHLESLHAKRPMEAGIVVDDVGRQMQAGSDILLRSALSVLLKEQKIRINNGLLSMTGHRPTVSSRIQQNWFIFSNILRQGGFQVPLLSEIEKQSGLSMKQMSALIIPALKSGELVQLSKKRYMLVETRSLLEAEITRLASQTECFSIIDVKHHLGLGRNLTIEILEYLDSIRFTRRKNDGRELVD